MAGHSSGGPQLAKREPRIYEIDNEAALGTITSLPNDQGKITVDMKNCSYWEIVKVGPNQILGEIIRTCGDTVTVQMYGKMSGLSVGDIVVGTKQPITIELGPSLLGNMCDAFQHSFEAMADGGSKMYIPQHGLDAPTILDKQKLWEFEPQNFKVGDHISGGDIFGKVYETPTFAHWIMLHPKKEGTIIYIAPTGYYTLEEDVLVIELKGIQTRITMVQRWPVRQPRPTQDKSSAESIPYYTGLRVIDGLFPIGLGLKGSICGGSGTGKATMCHSIAKNTNSEVVIYASCGKRGNELAEMRMTYPEKRMMRTHVVASTSDMPLHCQEIVGYTGITTSEYFRDQGYNTTFFLDSLSTWTASLASTVRDMPCSSGYPAYYGTRIANLCERASRVKCLGSPYRCGSITLFTTVRPPGGDIADPVASATFGIVESVWLTDKKLAQLRSFPPVNHMRSSSRLLVSLDEEMATLRQPIMEILRTEDDLSEIIALVGQDSLGESEQMLLEVASVIKETFIQQDLQTTYDKECPEYKTLWMMKNIVTYHHLASKIVEKATARAVISATREILYKLRKMKYEDPAEGEYVIVERMKRLNKDITKAFGEHS